MKILFFLIPLFFLVSCGGERISPSGLPYVSAEESQTTDELGEKNNTESEEETEQEEIETSEIEPEPEQTIPDDGILRLHMRPPITLNPLLNEDITVSLILQLIFEPLAVLDNEFRVTGHLAHLEFASDFGSVTATIREGAIWSDGIPVTADDIIFSIEFLRKAPSASIYSDKVSEIESVLRIDSRTLQINFNRASVMAGYSLNFPVIPRHHYENNEHSQMNPLGSGPFVFESITPMRSMTLRRNPHYSRGRVRIEEAEIIFLPNTETDFHAFERGRTDMLHLPLTEWTNNRGVRSPVYEIFPAMYFEFIGFNYKNNIFRDTYTRQGIAHAFNAAESVSGLYLAHAVHSVTPIHPHSFAAGAVSAPVYDPARAAALLGTVHTTAPLVIIANAENRQRATIAQRLAESLSAVGLDATAEIIPTEEYFERIRNFDFDLFIGGMELPFAPDIRIFFEAGEMFPHDPILEAAYSVLMFASTESSYAQATARLQQAFAEQLPVIGLAFKHSALLTSSRITGNLSPAPDYVFVNAFEWGAR